MENLIYCKRLLCVFAVVVCVSACGTTPSHDQFLQFQDNNIGQIVFSTERIILMSILAHGDLSKVEGIPENILIVGNDRPSDGREVSYLAAYDIEIISSMRQKWKFRQNNGCSYYYVVETSDYQDWVLRQWGFDENSDPNICVEFSPPIFMGF